MSKLRPILFRTEMVRAILDGRKIQTRRVVKNPENYYMDEMLDGLWPYKSLGNPAKCPYGKVGDVLWVRETWAPLGDYPLCNYTFMYKADVSKPYSKWKPSIHMPFAAARIFLRIKSVRVERLQDIDWKEAKAEGIQQFWMYGGVSVIGVPGLIYPKPNQAWTYTEAFSKLWESINGPESWESNPWVWVVEFEPISKEEAMS